MCLGNFLFLFKTTALFIHSETFFNYEISMVSIFLSHLKQKEIVLPVILCIHVCFLFGVFRSYHSIKFIFKPNGKKKEKFPIFKYLLLYLLSYLIIIFKNQTWGGSGGEGSTDKAVTLSKKLQAEICVQYMQTSDF